MAGWRERERDSGRVRERKRKGEREKEGEKEIKMQDNHRHFWSHISTMLFIDIHTYASPVYRK